jgi:hypothetical protein
MRCGGYTQQLGQERQQDPLQHQQQQLLQLQGRTWASSTAQMGRVLVARPQQRALLTRVVLWQAHCCVRCVSPCPKRSAELWS